MAEPKPFDVMRELFKGKQWTSRNGKAEGDEPRWHREKWPMHTAAEIGPKWEAPKRKGKK